MTLLPIGHSGLTISGVERDVRIAAVLSKFPALSESFILAQIAGLCDLGADVDLYASAPREVSEAHPDVAKYRLLDRTYYLSMSRARKYSKSQLPTARNCRLFLYNLRTQSVRTVAAARARAPGGLMTAWRMMSRGLMQAATKPYDVVHAQNGLLGVRVLRLQPYGLFRAPLVISFHGFDVSQYLRREGSDAYRELFQRGAAFLPVTEHWAGRLRDLGCPSNRIHVHRMGIDLQLFRYRPPREPLTGELRLLSVGRLVEKKGFTYGMDAVRQLLPDFPALRYDIIGEGPLRGDLECQIAGSGLQNVVRLMGAKDQPKVLDAMRASDVLLAPSVTAADGDMEGLPVVLMEAMAIGLPVVSTRHSGIPELVEDGLTGLLVEERDDVGLAAQLRRLLVTPRMRAQFARRARAKVEAEHDLAQQVRKLLDVYHSLAESAWPRGAEGCSQTTVGQPDRG